MPNRFRAGFQNAPGDIPLQRLPIHGKFPDWLRGTLVRNGPGQFDLSDAHYRHWFDGQAMLHAFTIDHKGVCYTARYLHSPAYLKDNETGKVNYRGFATDPCRSLFSRVFSIFSPPPDGLNTNVNITQLADEYIAMTETPMALRFSPRTLETLGVFDYQDPLYGQVTTAHPHFDFQRQIGLNYLLKLGLSNAYQVYGLNGTRQKLIASLPVGTPAYMHSFGVTARYIILAEFSLILPNVLAVAVGVKPFIENYRWMPDRPTRFIILDKDSGAVAATVETEPFFAFHHINAFERGDEIVLDVAAYPDSSLIDQLYLDALRGEDAGVTSGEFRRYRVPLKNGSQATYEVIGDQPIELPRINYRPHNGHAYRYAYGASVRQGDRDFINQIVKVDTETGEAKTWHQPGYYPSEPVFVASPNAKSEDEGVILSVVLDGARGTSFLLALDAASFTEIARAEVPNAVPFGFHGQFFNV
jgi:beta,beta-carotene 9',10'-dioxygenase